jgi:predicted Zn finger-like uncharacterized protein
MKFLCPNCKAKYRIGSEKLVGRQAAKIRCRKCDYRIQIAYRAGSEEYEITATPQSVTPQAVSPYSVSPLSISPLSVTPSAPPLRALKPAPTSPSPGVASPGVSASNTRPRAGTLRDELFSGRKPTAAVPGLPGLGSPKSTRGAILHTESPAPGGASALSPRRPIAVPPPPPGASSFGALSFGVPPPPALSASASAPSALSPGSPLLAGLAPGSLPPLAPPPNPAALSAQNSPQNSAHSSAPAPSAAARPVTGTQLADQFRQSVQAGGAEAEELPQDGWFVGVNGVPLGPIPVGDLRELAAAGHIDRRSLVWREGLAEWRPLGKFPQLARVLDEGASAPPAGFEPEGSFSSPGFTANGSNGHVATGFDSVRAPESEAERPSAWGDLDDEDDEDEQPTTVKGRVSMPPASMGGPPASQPQPPAPTFSLPPGATNLGTPFGLPPQARAANTGVIQMASAPPPSQHAPVVTMSTAQPMTEEADAQMMRSRGKARLFKWLIVAAAFALGAILTHMFGLGGGSSEHPQRPASEPTRALAPVEEHEPEAPPPPELEPAGVPGPARDRAAPVKDLGSDLGSETSANATGSKPAAGLVGLSPASVPPRTKPSSSLLSVLEGSPLLFTAVGTGPRPASDGQVGSLGGLNETAIQRSVRRYSRAVRQSCWDRALEARAPGVPSSARVSAAIWVDASGRVKSVSMSGAPRGYPGLARCIEGAVKGWVFPRADGETHTTVPFMFVGQ